ncbi:hypothetical protein [Streptomyces daliensis]
MKVYEPTKKGRKEFLKDVEIGATYYTIEESDTPFKGEKLWRSWVFTKRQMFTGIPMCGSMGADFLVNLYGPVYDSHPASDGHIRPLFADDDLELHVTPADVLKLREKKKARR